MTSLRKFVSDLKDHEIAELLDEFRLNTGASNTDTVRRWLFKVTGAGDSDSTGLDVCHEFMFEQKHQIVHLTLWSKKPDSGEVVSLSLRWDPRIGYQFFDVAVHVPSETGSTCEYADTGFCVPYLSDGNVDSRFREGWSPAQAVYQAFRDEGFYVKFGELESAFDKLDMYIKEGLPSDV